WGDREGAAGGPQSSDRRELGDPPAGGGETRIPARSGAARPPAVAEVDRHLPGPRRPRRGQAAHELADREAVGEGERVTAARHRIAGRARDPAGEHLAHLALAPARRGGDQPPGAAAAIGISSPIPPARATYSPEAAPLRGSDGCDTGADLRRDGHTSRTTCAESQPEGCPLQDPSTKRPRTSGGVRNAAGGVLA